MKDIKQPAGGSLPQFLTSKELQIYLRASRPTAEKFGKECGAERRVGRKMLFDRDTIDQALKQD